jgi:NTP pyrophosphatase (non-canonical NTP hydrolase)
MHLTELAKTCHDIAVDHGWWDDEGYERTFGDLCTLLHCEISEAYEEYRKGLPVGLVWKNEEGKPEGIPVELADVIIRLLDTCAYFGIDIEKVVQDKVAYNRGRPYRHGNKKV